MNTPLIETVNEDFEDASAVEEESTDTITILIPDCCREHWPSCPHVINGDKIKNKKQNIGL